MCNTFYKQNSIEKIMKGGIFLFSKKGNLRIIKNNRRITLPAKVYNVLLLNCIQPKIKKILKKQNKKKTEWLLKESLHNLTDSDNLSNHRRRMRMDLEATLLSTDFSKAFNSIHRGKME